MGIKTRATAEEFIICWDCEEMLEDGCEGCNGTYFSDGDIIYCVDGEHFCEDCYERLYNPEGEERKPKESGGEDEN